MAGTPAQIAAAHRAGPLGGRPRKTLNKEKIFAALASQGMTVRRIAQTVGVCEDTCWTWMRESRRLSEAYKRGRRFGVQRVVDALQSKAEGMTLPDSHVSSYEGQITVTPVVKHLAPDTLAQIFYCKNRDPAHWSDRQDVRLETTVAGLPEAMLDRMRKAALDGQRLAKAIDVSSVQIAAKSGEKEG